MLEREREREKVRGVVDGSEALSEFHQRRWQGKAEVSSGRERVREVSRLGHVVATYWSI